MHADVSSAPATGGSPRALMLWALLLVAVGLLFFLYWEGLVLMERWWGREEYSHGYMIPMVAAFLVWQRLGQLPAASAQGGAWSGALMVLFGLFLLLLGELSAIYTIIQYGFLISLTGLALAFFGWRAMLLLWVAFAYLIFMIPLPNFLYNNLSAQLQLVSSEIGVAVIRLFGISVYLEGNVIDLGVYQLAVVEACSGLRYLFPLMSFGFLVAVLYRGPVWQKAILFLATIPITVLMNSVRIGIIGVTVEHWGIAMAEGFLHDFEGWVIFIACLAVLLLIVWIFHLLSRDNLSMLERLHLDGPGRKVRLAEFPVSLRQQRPFLAALALLALLTPVLAGLDEREERPAPRQSFASFPLFHAGWIGREDPIEDQILEALDLSDYIKADYRNTPGGLPVNFYVAYYESQKKGAAIHSPRSCIPGGGWRITEFGQVEIEGLQHVSGGDLRVNRALIRLGNSAQLVYYWFEGRERNITNEYAAKWLMFWDALWHSRTDGALVRLVTPVPDMADIDEAEARLQQFARDFYPLLPAYVP